MNPRTFELEITADGTAQPGFGVLAAFVPAGDTWPAVVAMGCDPRHDPGRPISELAPAAIAWLRRELGDELGDAATSVCWAVIDGHGRFSEALPNFQKVGGSGTAAETQATTMTLRPFPGGASIDAFYREVGAAGEAAIELLSSIIEGPSQVEETPTMREFLDAVESHGSLPAPGAIFRTVEAAAEAGDARKMASAIQPDPVISASLINSANAARFAAAGKTASVPQAVSRLGTGFVRRVVFVAEMMSRYQKGVCPGFDYHGFWMNGIATGAAMRALLEQHEIPERMADDAFTTGLVAGIGWLAVAETFPALMARYLLRCKDSDPISKAKAQQEIFPCPIRQVSERYLQRFEFPEVIHAAVAGRTDVDRKWYDCLSQAIRVAQGLAPFDCLAVPTTVPAPDVCREEWQRWRDVLAARR